jgi:NAD(P)-dependent dehydrogenase (short-subunit alcohol dehydrogenase family)
MQDLRDKVAVVTGGASGIGFAVAQALGREGARLMLADIDASQLDEAVRRLKAAGVETEGLATDVSRKHEVERLADLAFDRFGAVHILMNNAGVAVFGATQDMTHEDWMWCINVNLWGPIHGVESFVPRMIAQGTGGHVLFTSSFAGLVSNRDLGAYNVTKAGVVALAESLRKDAAKAGIGVSVLCPMRVATNIANCHLHRPQDLGGAGTSTFPTDERVDVEGRVLSAEAVADLVLDAIRKNQLYIHTHKEAEKFVRTRADRIAAAFASAL